jgi:hypothetical protein
VQESEQELAQVPASVRVLALEPEQASALGPELVLAQARVSVLEQEARVDAASCAQPLHHQALQEPGRSQALCRAQPHPATVLGLAHRFRRRCTPRRRTWPLARLGWFS